MWGAQTRQEDEVCATAAVAMLPMKRKTVVSFMASGMRDIGGEGSQGGCAMARNPESDIAKVQLVDR